MYIEDLWKYNDVKTRKVLGEKPIPVPRRPLQFRTYQHSVNPHYACKQLYNKHLPLEAKALQLHHHG
jgi:hypothetical protein